MAAYEKLTGRKCVHLGLLQSLNPGESHFAVSVDGITQDGVLVEVKCPFSRIPNSTVPEHYVPQVQFMLHCLDIETCDFVQFVPGDVWTEEVLIVTRVLRDREWMAKAKPVLDLFWQDVEFLRGRPEWELRLPEEDERLDKRLRSIRKRASRTTTYSYLGECIEIDIPKKSMLSAASLQDEIAEYDAHVKADLQRLAARFNGEE